MPGHFVHTNHKNRKSRPPSPRHSQPRYPLAPPTILIGLVLRASIFTDQIFSQIRMRNAARARHMRCLTTQDDETRQSSHRVLPNSGSHSRAPLKIRNPRTASARTTTQLHRTSHKNSRHRLHRHLAISFRCRTRRRSRNTDRKTLNLRAHKPTCDRSQNREQSRTFRKLR